MKFRCGRRWCGASGCVILYIQSDLVIAETHWEFFSFVLKAVRVIHTLKMYIPCNMNKYSYTYLQNLLCCRCWFCILRSIGREYRPTRGISLSRSLGFSKRTGRYLNYIRRKPSTLWQPTRLILADSNLSHHRQSDLSV